MKKMGVLIFAGVLTLIISWGSFFSHPAKSQQLDSRITNLQADFNRLRSQVNQLESQLQNNPLPSPPRTTLTPRQPSPSQRRLSQRDQMFDRLATLVVELKQQVNALEKRVANLEGR